MSRVLGGRRTTRPKLKNILILGIIIILVVLGVGPIAIHTAHAVTLSSGTSSSKSFSALFTVAAGTNGLYHVDCPLIGDLQSYVLGGGFGADSGIVVTSSAPAGSGSTPTQWDAYFWNPTLSSLHAVVYVVCQASVGGSSSFTVSTTTITVSGGGANGLYAADCPMVEGVQSYATGGGFGVDHGMVVTSSDPTAGSPSTEWNAYFRNPTGSSLHAVVYVVCQAPVAGSSGFTVGTGTIAIGSGTNGLHHADCPMVGGVQTYAVGGGYLVDNGILVTDSSPTGSGSTPTQWDAYFWNPTGGSLNAVVVVDCQLPFTFDYPTISTSLSATTVTVGQNVYDTASLSGATASAGGTVSYYYYLGATCSGPASTWFGSPVTVTSGVVPNSGLGNFGYGESISFQAVYSGDTNNAGATSACEPLTVNKATPTISTVLSASTIIAGGSVHDTATITGGYSLGVSGTVTYNFYSNGICDGVAITQTVAVGADNNVPDSSSTIINAQGSYSWNAVYNGDASNNVVTSSCESLTVNPFTTTTQSSSTSSASSSSSSSTISSSSSSTSSSSSSTASSTSPSSSSTSTSSASQTATTSLASSTPTSTTGTSSGPAIPDLPYQLTLLPLFSLFVIGSYLLVRRRNLA